MLVQPPFRALHLRGPPNEAAHAYGLAFADTYHATRTKYLAELVRTARLSEAQTLKQAEVWLSRLPSRDQLQIESMAQAMQAAPLEFALYLYADIAGNSANPASMCSPEDLARLACTEHQDQAGTQPQSGPMCSTLVTPCPAAPAHAGLDTRPWVARNCDWLPITLIRGTCAVFHHNPGPGRIAFVALGIMGDLDCDTGLNRAGLWLHMHTMYSGDLPRPASAGVPSISWLFWMRHALETCETIADVEAFIAAHDRDRGVILIAVSGRTGQAALFECSRCSYLRVDPLPRSDPVAGPAGTLLVTNHCRAKHPEMPEHHRRAAGISRPNSTVRRYNRLLEIMAQHPPEFGPDDLMDTLADDEIEMRTAESVRTIYSVVAQPASERIWFASGAVPAASRGTWHNVAVDWT